MKVMSMAEALTVFAVIMTYIWKLRPAYPSLWLLPLALIVASHAVRRESMSTLGFQMTSFPACVRQFGVQVTVLTLAIWGVGILAGSLRPMGVAQALASLAAYLPWGLFQQYLLNGYFLRRFEADLSRSAAVKMTAALFCLVHAPNWFLMIVTLFGAFAAVAVYRRCHNLWFLGTAHGVIGFTLFMEVPDFISHHLRVGPGWFTYR
jgi:membrane protease YdiL (CAAX protease family)